MGLRRRLAGSRGSGILLRLCVDMMANRASGSGAEQCVVSGDMACDASGSCTGDASSGLGATGKGRHSDHGHYRGSKK